LDAKDYGFVGHLYKDSVIGAEEKQEICGEEILYRANEKLLSILSRKSPQQYLLFLKALINSGQQHVYNIITKQSGFSI